MISKLCLAVIGFQLVALAATAGTNLKFQVPAGWIDLSPGAPAENFTKVPPQVASSAKDPAVVAFGIDIAGATDGFAMNFNARDVGPVATVDEAAVKEIVAGLSGQANKAMPGADYKVLKSGTTTIGGVIVGRCESQMTMNNLTIRQLVYIMTDGTRGAVVTYSASPKQWEQNLAMLDQTAQATRGVKAVPGKWSNVLSGAGWGALRGALIGLIVAAVMGLTRRKA